MLIIFTFVFGEIFQAKWAGSNQVGGLDFAAALFAGLLIYNFFAECIGNAPSQIVGNVNYVKKVVFPLEILSTVTVITALFHFLAAYSILIGLILLSEWHLSWTAVYIPIIFLPFIGMVLGFSWGISALGVYLRDISQLISPILTAILFLSPVFYPLSSVNRKLVFIYHLNPLTFVIEQIRSVLLHNQQPDWQGLAIFSVLSVLIAVLGYMFFQKTRSGFADIL